MPWRKCRTECSLCPPRTLAVCSRGHTLPLSSSVAAEPQDPDAMPCPLQHRVLSSSPLGHLNSRILPPHQHLQSCSLSAVVSPSRFPSLLPLITSKAHHWTHSRAHALPPPCCFATLTALQALGETHSVPSLHRHPHGERHWVRTWP